MLLNFHGQLEPSGICPFWAVLGHLFTESLLLSLVSSHKDGAGLGGEVYTWNVFYLCASRQVFPCPEQDE